MSFGKKVRNGAFRGLIGKKSNEERGRRDSSRLLRFETIEPRWMLSASSLTDEILATASVAAEVSTATDATTASTTVTTTREMENLDRGVVAVRSATSQVFVSWRLLALDPSGVGFNVYRSAGGAAAVKLNSTVLTGGTNYVDTTANLAVSNAYYVCPVVNGVEQTASESFTLAADATVGQYLSIPLQNIGDYYVHFTWVGDLDGDGAYEFIVDRLPTSSADNTAKLQAYELDGTVLWSIDTGPNSTYEDQNDGAEGSIDIDDKDGVTVYDMDGDGRAEVLMKTATGAVFGDGKTLTTPGGVNQFISVIDGLTGAERSRIALPEEYIADGALDLQVGIGYLDGTHPSLIAMMENRVGTARVFNRVAVAYDYDGTTITQRWRWDRGSLNCPDFHSIRIVDVDLDGKDEICDGGYVIDDNGTLLYTLADSGVAHGDRFYIGDFDPSRPGLEGYGIQQTNASGLTEYFYEAATGKMIWTHSAGVYDVGRGLVADIDPNYAGYEAWTTAGTFTNVETDTLTPGTTSVYPNLRIWWDGDLLGEHLYDTRLAHWNYANGWWDRELTAYQTGATATWRDVPTFYADVFGDWREEIIYEKSDHTALQIYTTTYTSDYRIYSLAQDPEYRNCMTTKGYYQSNMLDYYLGADMTTPSTPNIEYVARNAASKPTVVTAATAASTLLVCQATGCSVNLNALAEDATGEKNLTYTWSGIGPGVVKFSANDANESKNTTAYFSAAGDYVLNVIIKNAAGGFVRSTVKVTVKMPTLFNAVGAGTITSSGESTTYPASNAFNNSSTDKWYNNGTGTTGWLQYDFGAGTAVAVTQYVLTSAYDYSARDPKSWTFLGSNDGVTWTTIDTQTSQLFGNRCQTKFYSLNNTIAFRYYRLNITANNGDSAALQLGELKLMVAVNNPTTGGTATASSQLSAEPASNAFDGSTSTNWASSDVGGTGTLQYDFGSGTTSAVVSYKVTSAADAQETDPAAWQFQASNDGTTWVTLDTRSAEVFATRSLTKQYAVSNSTAYRYYRLNITANYGGTTYGLQVGEMSFVGLNKAPTVATAASATPSAVVGPTTNLGVLGADFSGESNLTYTWSATGPATVTYSVSGTNAAKNTIASFTQVGTYVFTATITDTGGLSVTSSITVTVTSLSAAALSVPSALSATVASATQVNLTWADNSSNESGFVIEWATNSAFTQNTASKTVAANSTSASVTGLNVATTYYFRIRAYDAYGNYSAYASTVSATTSSLTPAAWYLCNSTSGSTLTDSSGNAKNGTLSGSYSFVSGYSGNALDLSGGYASLPTGIVSGLTNFTIASWVKFDSLANWQRVFDFGTGTSVYMFLTTYSGKFRFAITTGSGEQIVNSSVGIDIGVWTHVAVALSGNTCTLYMNGVAVGSNTTMTLTPSSLGSTTKNYIGDSQFTADPALDGKIDDFRIYNQALTPAQFVTTAPTISVAPTALTTTVTGNSTTLNVLGADDGGETSLKYFWAATGPGIVSFSGNGTNAGKTATATFSKAGSYALTVKITDSFGLFVTSSVINVTVVQTLTTAAVSPKTAEVNVNKTKQFSAWAYDQFGDAMIATFTWSVIGGGTITSTGLYTAPSEIGQAEVRVSSGAIFADTVLSISDALVVYKADGYPAMATLIDSSGNGNNATLTGAYDYLPSVEGESLNLTGGAANLPSGIVSGLANFTIATWVKLSSVSNWARIFDFGTGTSAYMFLSPQVSTGKPRFAIKTSSGSEQVVNSSVAISTGVWTHIAVTLSGNTCTLYINGVAVGTNTSMTYRPSNLGTTTQNYIGDSQFSADPSLAGCVDDFRIYGRALTAAQVTSLVASSTATRMWDGGGDDNKWSTAENWVGDVAPSSGENIVFPTGASRLSSVNDLTGVTFGSVSVSGTGYSLDAGNITATTVTVGSDAVLVVGTLVADSLILGGTGSTESSSAASAAAAASIVTEVTAVSDAAIISRTATGSTASTTGKTAETSVTTASIVASESNAVNSATNDFITQTSSKLKTLTAEQRTVAALIRDVASRRNINDIFVAPIASIAMNDFRTVAVRAAALKQATLAIASLASNPSEESNSIVNQRKNVVKKLVAGEKISSLLKPLASLKIS